MGLSFKPDFFPPSAFCCGFEIAVDIGPILKYNYFGKLSNAITLGPRASLRKPK